MRDPEACVVSAGRTGGPFDELFAAGRAPLAREGVRFVRWPAEVGGCFTGENVDCAELGRSGILRAASAFLWAIIASLTDGRTDPAPFLDLPRDPTELLRDEARDDALGLPGSRSRSCFDFASRFDMILLFFIRYIRRLRSEILTVLRSHAKSKQMPNMYFCDLL